MLRRLVLALALVCTPGLALAERVALVIGMSAYQSITPLKNTLNDAERIAQKLTEIGFTVTLATDKSQSQLLDIMDTFAFQAETADLALVYYAGHGVEVQGVNYLVPVDARVSKAEDITRVGISLNQLLKTVEKARQMRVVILDSCRNNPFTGIAGFDTGADTSLSGNTADPTAPAQGLAPVNPKLGTMVAYAAKAGQVALDGLGDNSPYATALIDAFGRPNVEIGMMFRQVRDEVLKATGNLQEPFQYGSLPGSPFFLNDQGGGAAGGAELDWSQIEIDVSTEDLMLQLAAEGSTRELLGLASRRLTPGTPSFDPTKGIDFMIRAADAGNAEAQFELAKLYEFGTYVPADPAKALHYYQAAADQGLPEAVNNMGFFTYDGRLGLTPDPEKALALFAQAADLRDPEAMFNYASLIDNGSYPGKGPQDAAFYLYDALRAGSKAVLAQLETNAGSFTQPTRKALQKLLRQNSFYEGPLDGDFGPSTQKAIRLAFGLKD